MEHMTGAHFRALRTYLGYSVTEIADYLHVSVNSARAWDKGACHPPIGVVEELEELRVATARVVDYLTRHYTKNTAEWPMELPRSAAYVDAMLPTITMPGPVTVDWWKCVGMRVCEQVPGLWLEWA